MTENKFSLNFLLIPVLLLLFIPTFFIENMEFFSIIFAVLMTMVYPVYLTLANSFYFKDKSPKDFLKNSYLMILAMVLNLGISSLVMFEKFLDRGPEILMIIFFIFVGLICTIIGVVSVYIYLVLKKKELTKRIEKIF
ncbi:MAG: hypothetical protein PHT07_00130 [Paludibacter sp.]|nr:hypothetical protein [Paludibacter sp.]